MKSEVSFTKAERLCSHTLIEGLYAEGHRMLEFPYSVQWRIAPLTESPCQVLIVAPKRKFHHAVDRNRVKRLTRECYRQHKSQLYSFLHDHGITLTLALVYIHTDIMPYDTLMKRMEKLIVKLQKEISDETCGSTAD